MIFTSFASSSQGNLYSLESASGGKLLLEAGLPGPKIKKALGYSLSSFDACLVSHEHMDHAKGAKAVFDAGVKIYGSRGTINAIGVAGHCPEGFFSLAGFSIKMFPTIHDAAEPTGFHFKDLKTGETAIFATDTRHLQFRFPALDHLFVECNYVERLVPDDCLYRRRLIDNHMGLEDLKTWLSLHDTSKLKTVRLLHLSRSHSDEKVILDSLGSIVFADIQIAEE